MPNLYLYNVTVSGFCWVNLIEDAYHQLRLMQEEGLLPSLVHMAGLVKLIGLLDCLIGWMQMVAAPLTDVHTTLN
jgi:hypothetical protein